MRVCIRPTFFMFVISLMPCVVQLSSNRPNSFRALILNAVFAMGLARTGVLLAWGAVSFRARFVTEAVLSFVICVTDQVSITGKHVSDVTERDVTVVPIAVEQAVSNVPSVMVLE